MKLQALQEGIQSRTQRARQKRRLGKNINAYNEIVQEIAEVFMPLIEESEEHIYHSMREDPGVPDDELPNSVEEHFQAIGEFDRRPRWDYTEGLENDVNDALAKIWDKKWNSN